MLHVAISKLAHAHKRVYMALSDFDKCFDRFDRNIIIINAHESGIKGRNIRMIENEMHNSTAHISWNGKMTKEIRINTGNPQGHKARGVCSNLYTNRAIEAATNANSVFLYNHNISAFQYSDDGEKI